MSATKAFVSGSTSAEMAGTEDAEAEPEAEAGDSHGAAGAGEEAGESPGSHAVSHASFHSSSPVAAGRGGGGVRRWEERLRRPEVDKEAAVLGMGRRRARRRECMVYARRNAAQSVGTRERPNQEDVQVRDGFWVLLTGTD